MSMTPAQQNTAYLMQVLQFNADELLLNRQGQLSPAQAQRVGAQLRAGTASAWKIMLFVLIVFVIGFGALLLFGGLDLTMNEAPIILLGVGGTMLVWGVMVVVALIRSRAQANKGSWPVYQVSGPVKVNLTADQMIDPMARAAMSFGGEGVADGTIQIGKTYVAIWADAAQAFIPGNPYTVYYVGSKRGGLPVSAEAMEASSARR
jgi:hypothetical protein